MHQMQDLRYSYGARASKSQIIKVHAPSSTKKFQIKHNLGQLQIPNLIYLRQNIPILVILHMQLLSS